MQNMLVKYLNKPKKSDLKPFDIVRNARGDLGTVSRRGRTVFFVNTHLAAGSANYTVTIAECTNSLKHTNSQHDLVELIRIPNVVYRGD